ncbi:glucosamine 6-phosphate N-acetyltransferase [Auriscalpium vulgare]|uniref:Glucosamine 6-phosphate N-acetyltransferase n=1 Tax=Auriscalpium vulgare TaxID=40419 RepID=A0ACB8RYT2_9AGAM|nr:glucosamine 6-phosphate N-acetyltransferase [Auriscalpium vulgare]
MPSLTPDADLELLFPPTLIPQHVRDALPADLHIRPLAATDNTRGHLPLLNILSPAPDPGPAAYAAHFAALRAVPGTYFTIVLLARDTDRVVAVGTVFLERKFTRGLSVVGHIEDIAVDPTVQGKGLGKRIITALIGMSESLSAYKTILNCSDSNIPFYEKCGFKRKENEMAKYAPERAHTPRL